LTQFFQKIRGKAAELKHAAATRIRRLQRWVKAILCWAFPLLLIFLWLAIAWVVSYLLYAGENPISLFLLVSGSCISASATFLAAKEAGLQGPHLELRDWLQHLPRYATFDQINAELGDSLHVNLLPPEVSIRTVLKADASTDEKINYLVQKYEQLRTWRKQEILQTKAEISALKRNAKALQKDSEQAANDLRKEIREISTSKFYQVFGGFLLIAAGSIVGAWDSPSVQMINPPAPLAQPEQLVAESHLDHSDRPFPAPTPANTPASPGPQPSVAGD